MPLFKLSKSARALLASCIEIGVEGAEEWNDDKNAVMNILDELRESEADETIVHIAPTPLYHRELGEQIAASLPTIADLMFAEPRDTLDRAPATD